jgi:2-amino-4-hydroxy-6-hydroxymethyldihydropteridine diphosphokinase
MITHKAYVALGSNLDHPHQQVLTAMEAIDALPGCSVVKRSSLYVTKPVGYLDQPDFVNAVIELSTTLPPLDLLHALQSIEQAQGRIREFKNGPRTIDCDLILYEDCVMNTDELVLPHPRMHERDFVLKPLAEIVNAEVSQT